MHQKPTYGELELQILDLKRQLAQHRQWEQELLESQQLLTGIFHAIPVRVFWKNLDLVYLGCNEAFAHDAGLQSPKDLIGKDDYEMGWIEQAELYRADDMEVIKSGVPKLLIEEPQTTPDGRTITLLTSKIPLRDEKGAITGVLGTYMDITAKKEIEEALKVEKSRLREAYNEIEHLHDIIPICSSCKKIRDDQGYWDQVERYIQKHSHAKLSHGICPDCMKRLYPYVNQDHVQETEDPSDTVDDVPHHG